MSIPVGSSPPSKLVKIQESTPANKTDIKSDTKASTYIGKCLNQLKNFLHLKITRDSSVATTRVNATGVSGIKNRFKKICKGLKEVFNWSSQIDGKNRANEEVSMNGSYPKLRNAMERPLPPTPIRAEITLKDINLTSTCTPQAVLGGFGDAEGISFYSSELGSAEHISNLWKHDIEVNNQKLSFIRSGSTRGNEVATKELLANAVALQCDVKKLKDNQMVTLNLSNIQLMTPVKKMGDGGIPLKQMEKLWDLYVNKKQTEVKYGNKTIKIQLTDPPLLFNFGVNVQHFRMGKLAHSKEIDEFNKKSFIQLFGKDPVQIKQTHNEYYFSGSLIGKFLNESKDADKKKQVEALANQIGDILQKYPNGMESNPYALPVRVMLLTHLLGYATTYNCKSGKDRTGVCAMELETLAAKLLSSGELYDPENPSEEEKNILQQLYLEGEAVKIAQMNKDQKGLLIQEMFGFNSLKKRFGIKLEGDFSKNETKLLVEEGNKLYKELSKEMEALTKEQKSLMAKDKKLGQNLNNGAIGGNANFVNAGIESKKNEERLKDIEAELKQLGDERMQIALLIEELKSQV